jgi:hypothetical protein
MASARFPSVPPAEARKIRGAAYVGAVVHYVPPDGTACMAAVVTEVHALNAAAIAPFPAPGVNHPLSDDLADVRYEPGAYIGGPREWHYGPLEPITCDDLRYEPRTWHFIGHPEAS